MNVVKAGNQLIIYGEDVQTYKTIPLGTYEVNFHQMRGWYLTPREDLVITEEKIYGNSTYKVQKVINSYKLTDRNFGVLLSGQKGIGKSLFVRLLAQKAREINLPVIVVSAPYPGLAQYISSITQDCIVIFDEFEKVFADSDDRKPQDELLSLFDGIDGGHKLFIVTCNDLTKLNEYMINRPGRFHYHFTMTPPTADEVREYLEDKLLPQYKNIIDDIVGLIGVIDLPYDYLRAITFDVNQGYPIKEVMSDLNITRIDTLRFDLKAYLSNGMVFEAWNERIDLSGTDYSWIRFKRYRKDANDRFPEEFNTQIFGRDAKLENGIYVIRKHLSKGYWDTDDFYGVSDEEAKQLADIWNNTSIEYITLHRIANLGPTRLLV